MNLDWEANSNTSGFLAAERGDIVHLKLINSYEYLVKAIVNDATEGKIVAVVEAVLDWHDRVNIVAADVSAIVGSSISFPPMYVHKIIKAELR